MQWNIVNFTLIITILPIKIEQLNMSCKYLIFLMNVSEESTPKCWMDKRLVIKPWKVELVQRYFTNPRSQVPVIKLERKERSNGADVIPPLGDPPKAAPLMHGVQDQEGISSSSSTTSSPLSSVSISRPQLISKMNVRVDGLHDLLQHHS